MGAALVATAAALWGTGGALAAIIARNGDLSLFTISAIRLLIGGLLMIAVTAATGHLRRVPRTREAGRHIALTALLVALYGGAFFQSLTYIDVAVAVALSLGAAPLTAALIEAARSRRRPDQRTSLALTLSVLGLVLITDVLDVGFAMTPTSLAGYGLALFSGVAFAGTTVVNQKHVRGLSPATLIATSFTLAGLLCVVVSIPAGLRLDTLNGTGWAALAFLATVQTTGGYLIFYLGLQRGVSPPSAAVLSLLEPVTAAAVGVLILDEDLAPATAAGIVLLLLAILLVPRAPSAATRNVN